jgi:3-carboxy-cis,cis-muconate cycloisomerase
MSEQVRSARDSGLLSPGWAGTDVNALVDDAAFLLAMLDVETALARAQAKLGIIPPDAADAIAGAAKPGRIDMVALGEGVRATANPVVSLVGQLTSAVAAANPTAAEFVHRGCTSQDILDSALMLLCARTFGRIQQDLRRCADALAGLAREHTGTVMAGRTLTQHAVPITFGLKAAGWLQLVLDAMDRCRSVARTGLFASLGGAAGTLSAYAEYAELAGVATDDGIGLVAPFAAELRLREPLLPWHGLRTPIADVAYALTFLVGAIGKIAVDVQVMARTEISELAEPTASGRGASSTMPQKHNPVFATLIRTAAEQLPAHALILFRCMVVEDERSAGGWHAEWQPLRECLRLGAGAVANAAALLDGLIVRPERMRANLMLTGAAVVSERFNAVLAPVLGKVDAKRLLTLVSETAADSGADFVTVLDRLLRERGHAVDISVLRQTAEPTRYLGAAGKLVARALDRYDKLCVSEYGDHDA